MKPRGGHRFGQAYAILLGNLISARSFKRNLPFQSHALELTEKQPGNVTWAGVQRIVMLHFPRKWLSRFAHFLLTGWGIFALSVTSLAAAPELHDDIDFIHDVRPILADHCFACHGPDAREREADLRLDVRDSAVEVEAIVPGDALASELVRRINEQDPDLVMPPPVAKKPLSAEQKRVLERWIAEGAEFSQHWAFVAPRRPALPVVEHAVWTQGAIDLFVLARLEQQGLTPSPEADRRTLIRRLSLDLTGLPPNPQEVQAFIDNRSEGAYEQLVDRLLASRRYGERMAQHWLDLARYGDSDGYHDDTSRAMWPYRDYVIESFNKNKPFDEFTREQIAGDQIPDGTLEQKVGSAFHRNGPTSSEGGANPEEYRVKYAVDRVNTTAAVWLGVTLQCTECHDHKYDPFTQREFYQLFAFFDQVPGNHLHRGFYAPPSIDVPTAELREKMAALGEEISALEDQLSTGQQGTGQTGTGDDEQCRTQIELKKKELAAIQKGVPRLRVMQDAPERTPTYILIRGDFRNHGEQVEPGVPVCLPELPTARTPRLALADWLTDPGNPLPARVTVNRLWAMLFGTGIVKTANDFGTRGDLPSHPLLLDWLAVEFVESGWDVRQLLKQIVMSATYRQSSAASTEQIARDPENRLLSRGPRFRLPAETVRDNALFIAGMLNEKIGGPSVKPYQPPGLWREMAYGEGGGRKYVQDHGENLYRRGLYTFWKRSILYPAFAVFDAPNREECTVSRPVTITPLQALVLLNDVTFVEAARVFAERILVEGGGTFEERIDYAVQNALARPPETREREVLQGVYRDLLAHFQANPEASQELTAAGEWPPAKNVDPAEHAAWTSVAQAILNLDETVTKH